MFFRKKVSLSPYTPTKAKDLRTGDRIGNKSVKATQLDLGMIVIDFTDGSFAIVRPEQLLNVIAGGNN